MEPGGRPADDGLAEAPPDLLHAPLQPFLLFPPCLLPEQAQLPGGGGGDQLRAPDAHAAEGTALVPVGLHQGHGRPVQLRGQTGRGFQDRLPLEGIQAEIPQADLHRTAEEAPFPQTGGHALAQHPVHGGDILQAGQIPGRGHGIAHALHRALLPRPGHGGQVIAVGKPVEHGAHLAEPALQVFRRSLRQLADGLHPVVPELPPGGGTHVQQIRHRQGPDLFPHLPAGEDRHRIRLFVIRAQLGENLIVAHSHGDRHPQLRLDPAAQLMGQGFPSLPLAFGTGNIQPAFVQAEGFHPVRILPVDLPGQAGEAHILVIMGMDDHQIRALLPGLPQGLPCFYPEPLGQLILGQNDPVPRLRVASHRHGLVPKGGLMETFHAGIKAVHICMEDDPPPSFHRPSLPSSAL